MKYWLLTTEYPPFYGGGISTYCYHTCSMLTEKGHEVTVFINDKRVQSVEIERKTEARIIRFNPDISNTDTFLGTNTHLSYAFAQLVKQFIGQEGKPDVIESQDYNGIGYFILQFKYCLEDVFRDIPIVVTMHSPSFLYLEYNEVPIYKAPNFWIGEMERFSIQAADLLISPSQYLIDELEKRIEITNKNLHVLVNPYKYTHSETPAGEAVFGNGIAFYGKLSPQKGTFKILEAFRQLWDKGFKENFTMIGGQDIVFHPQGKTMGTIVKKEYKKYIERGLLKLKNEIAPADRASFLSTYSIFLVPSIVDNLPYVVLELMSLGKIVIVSKQGGQSEIVSDNVDGFIFNYDEPTSFESTIKKVLSLTNEQRIEVSERSIKKVQTEFEYENVYAQKIKLLNEVRSKSKTEKKFPFIRNKELSIPLSDQAYTNKALLSVVIPYYNLGAYVDATIQSILKSSYEHMEVLIVNDGSTDPMSLEKLNTYRTHERIKVIDKANTGLADTRNKAAEIATGSFLAFLDADDTVNPTYYEKAIDILCAYSNVHFVGAWTKYMDKSTAVWPTFNPEPPLLLVQNSINSSALIYKREAFLKGGKNDPDFKIGLEDYESIVHLKANGLNGVAIPTLLFNYRVRKNSMISGVNKEVRADYYSKIEEKHAAFFGEYKKDIQNLIKWNGAPLSGDNATLDDLPFQQVPVLGKVVRRLIRIAKANPGLKKGALLIKRILQKQ